MKLYWSPRTRAVRVRWMLEELEVPYELVRVDRQQEDPAYRAIHPLGKVPALVEDDGTPLIESAALVLHLADRFPDKRLAPDPGTIERGRYYQWVLYGVGTMEPAAIGIFMASEEGRPKAMQAAAAVMQVVAEGLEGPFLLGEQFTGADIIMGSMLAWAKSQGMLPAEGPLTAYAERLMARPAYQRATADE